MYNDVDMISQIFILAIFLNIVAGQVESLVGKLSPFDYHMLKTIFCKYKFISQVCFQPICCKITFAGWQQAKLEHNG
jgi:hypothetical protein